MKGNVFCKAGILDQALLYYTKAVEVNPESQSVNSSLAEIYRHAGKMKEAISHYKKALSVKIDLAGTFFAMCNAKQYTCDWEDYQHCG